MNLREMMLDMQANAMAGNAGIYESPPGVGKSDVGAQFAMWWKRHIQSTKPKARVGMAVCFIATASPISASGMPWRSTQTWDNPVTGQPVEYTFTSPAVPQWAMAVDLDTGEMRPVATFDSVVLFLEEWGQGSAEAKRAFAEVLRAGGTPEHKLPPGSPRFGFSNMDSRDGVTKEFDFIINRAARNTVRGDAKIWHDDFADKPYQWQGRTWQMLGVSKVWAIKKPNILFEDRPEKQGPWCTARSFTAQDRYVQVRMQLNGGVIPVDDPSFVEGCAAHCGMNQTQDYVSTLRFMLELPSYEAVVSDPMGTPVPTKSDLQLLMAYELAGRVEQGHLGPVIKYMEKRDSNGKGMTKDLSITFITTVLRRDPRLINAPAMDAWITNGNNAHLVATIGALTK